MTKLPDQCNFTKQKVIIPKGTVRQNETAIIEIPIEFQNEPIVVVKPKTLKGSQSCPGTKSQEGVSLGLLHTQNLISAIGASHNELMGVKNTVSCDHGAICATEQLNSIPKAYKKTTKTIITTIPSVDGEGADSCTPDCSGIPSNARIIKKVITTTTTEGRDGIVTTTTVTTTTSNKQFPKIESNEVAKKTEIDNVGTISTGTASADDNKGDTAKHRSEQVASKSEQPLQLDISFHEEKSKVQEASENKNEALNEQDNSPPSENENNEQDASENKTTENENNEPPNDSEGPSDNKAANDENDDPKESSNDRAADDGNDDPEEPSDDKAANNDGNDDPKEPSDDRAANDGNDDPEQPSDDKAANSDGNDDPEEPSGDKAANSDGNDDPEEPSDDKAANSDGNDDPEEPSDDKAGNNDGNDDPEEPSDDKAANNDGNDDSEEPSDDKPANDGNDEPEEPSQDKAANVGNDDLKKPSEEKTAGDEDNPTEEKAAEDDNKTGNEQENPPESKAFENETNQESAQKDDTKPETAPMEEPGLPLAASTPKKNKEDTSPAKSKQSESKINCSNPKCPYSSSKPLSKTEIKSFKRVIKQTTTSTATPDPCTGVAVCIDTNQLARLAPRNLQEPPVFDRTYTIINQSTSVERSGLGTTPGQQSSDFAPVAESTRLDQTYIVTGARVPAQSQTAGETYITAESNLTSYTKSAISENSGEQPCSHHITPSSLEPPTSVEWNSRSTTANARLGTGGTFTITDRTISEAGGTYTVSGPVTTVSNGTQSDLNVRSCPAGGPTYVATEPSTIATEATGTVPGPVTQSSTNATRNNPCNEQYNDTIKSSLGTTFGSFRPPAESTRLGTTGVCGETFTVSGQSCPAGSPTYIITEPSSRATTDNPCDQPCHTTNQSGLGTSYGSFRPPAESTRLGTSGVCGETFTVPNGNCPAGGSTYTVPASKIPVSGETYTLPDGSCPVGGATYIVSSCRTPMSGQTFTVPDGSCPAGGATYTVLDRTTNQSGFGTSYGSFRPPAESTRLGSSGVCGETFTVSDGSCPAGGPTYTVTSSKTPVCSETYTIPDRSSPAGGATYSVNNSKTPVVGTTYTISGGTYRAGDTTYTISSRSTRLDTTNSTLLGPSGTTNQSGLETSHGSFRPPAESIRLGTSGVCGETFTVPGGNCQAGGATYTVSGSRTPVCGETYTISDGSCAAGGPTYNVSGSRTPVCGETFTVPDGSCPEGGATYTVSDRTTNHSGFEASYGSFRSPAESTRLGTSGLCGETFNVPDRNCPAGGATYTVSGSKNPVSGETYTIPDGSCPAGGPTYTVSGSKTPVCGETYTVPDGSCPAGGATYTISGSKTPVCGATYTVSDGSCPAGGATYTVSGYKTPMFGETYTVPDGGCPAGGATYTVSDHIANQSGVETSYGSFRPPADSTRLGTSGVCGETFTVPDGSCPVGGATYTIPDSKTPLVGATYTISDRTYRTGDKTYTVSSKTTQLTHGTTDSSKSGPCGSTNQTGLGTTYGSFRPPAESTRLDTSGVCGETFTVPDGSCPAGGAIYTVTDARTPVCGETYTISDGSYPAGGVTYTIPGRSTHTTGKLDNRFATFSPVGARAYTVPSPAVGRTYTVSDRYIQPSSYIASDSSTTASSFRPAGESTILDNMYGNYSRLATSAYTTGSGPYTISGYQSSSDSDPSGTLNISFIPPVESTRIDQRTNTLVTDFWDTTGDTTSSDMGVDLCDLLAGARYAELRPLPVGSPAISGDSDISPDSLEVSRAETPSWNMTGSFMPRAESTRYRRFGDQRSWHMEYSDFVPRAESSRYSRFGNGGGRRLLDIFAAKRYPDSTNLSHEYFTTPETSPDSLELPSSDTSNAFGQLTSSFLPGAESTRIYPMQTSGCYSQLRGQSHLERTQQPSMISRIRPGSERTRDFSPYRQNINPNESAWIRKACPEQLHSVPCVDITGKSNTTGQLPSTSKPCAEIGREQSYSVKLNESAWIRKNFPEEFYSVPCVDITDKFNTSGQQPSSSKTCAKNTKEQFFSDPCVEIERTRNFSPCSQNVKVSETAWVRKNVSEDFYSVPCVDITSKSNTSGQLPGGSITCSENTREQFYSVPCTDITGKSNTSEQLPGSFKPCAESTIIDPGQLPGTFRPCAESTKIDPGKFPPYFKPCAESTIIDPGQLPATFRPCAESTKIDPGKFPPYFKPCAESTGIDSDQFHANIKPCPENIEIVSGQLPDNFKPCAESTGVDPEQFPGNFKPCFEGTRVNPGQLPAKFKPCAESTRIDPGQLPGNFRPCAESTKVDFEQLPGNFKPCAESTKIDPGQFPASFKLCAESTGVVPGQLPSNFKPCAHSTKIDLGQLPGNFKPCAESTRIDPRQLPSNFRPCAESTKVDSGQLPGNFKPCAESTKIDPGQLPASFKPCAESTRISPGQLPGNFKPCAESTRINPGQLPGNFKPCAESTKIKHEQLPANFEPCAESTKIGAVQLPGNFIHCVESTKIDHGQLPNSFEPSAENTTIATGQSSEQFYSVPCIEIERTRDFSPCSQNGKLNESAWIRKKFPEEFYSVPCVDNTGKSNTSGQLPSSSKPCADSTRKQFHSVPCVEFERTRDSSPCSQNVKLNESALIRKHFPEEFYSVPCVDITGKSYNTSGQLPSSSKPCADSTRKQFHSVPCVEIERTRDSSPCSQNVKLNESALIRKHFPEEFFSVPCVNITDQSNTSGQLPSSSKRCAESTKEQLYSVPCVEVERTRDFRSCNENVKLSESAWIRKNFSEKFYSIPCVDITDKFNTTGQLPNSYESCAESARIIPGQTFEQLFSVPHVDVTGMNQSCSEAIPTNQMMSSSFGQTSVKRSKPNYKKVIKTTTVTKKDSKESVFNGTCSSKQPGYRKVTKTTTITKTPLGDKSSRFTTASRLSNGKNANLPISARTDLVSLGLLGPSERISRRECPSAVQASNLENTVGSLQASQINAQTSCVKNNTKISSAADGNPGSSTAETRRYVREVPVKCSNSCTKTEEFDGSLIIKNVQEHVANIIKSTSSLKKADEEENKNLTSQNIEQHLHTAELAEQKKLHEDLKQYQQTRRQLVTDANKIANLSM